MWRSQCYPAVVPSSAMPASPSIVAVRKRVAENVKRLRAGVDLTQEQLAERAGLATRHLQKVEAGTVNATFKTVAALASGLGVDVGELFAPPSPSPDVQ